MKQYKITDFTQDSNDPTSYDGTVVVGGKELGVSIILEDEGETEKVEQLMSTFFNEIDTLLPKAKECIANEFLDLYNDNWRFGDDDEDDPDKPELTKEEFMEALSLQSLLFYSEDVEIFFDNNDIFLGHSLIASDFDGENFNYSQMFG